uniref:probable serine/threonine-protein kinase WNK3 n=1 Tax=Erigeron canadensis TaxID=72917 RepID=UPI001CB9628B|nr:probable serine/threonine-protein kinase WNK3 [Erigeron canadensis]
MVLMGSEAMKSKQEFDQEEEDGEDVIVERCYKNRYVRFNEVLGRGAFKTVYKGFDEDEGVEVAWNQVSLNDSMQSSQNMERICSEIRFLKTLRHENIIKSYVSWVDDKKKTINMITELFTSGSLREFRMKHKGIDLIAIKNWARQILGGLVYLHSHEPPIIHRNLSCDNLFVNGNHGEVKIGDLGLATLMKRPAVNGLIKTPEFMAPELYEDEYDELVDIYSFGMCMLELITCEYPYSECKDPSEIRGKVSSGVKPLCLSKVKDPQAKEFIEKCLVPVSQRLPANELLKDPFLAQSGSIKVELESVDNEAIKVNLIEVPKPDDKMSLGSPCVKKNNDLSKNEADNMVMLKMRVVDFDGRGYTVEFPFYLEVDDPDTIAKYMVEEVDKVHDDVATIAEQIKDQVMKLAPTWKPSCGNKSSSSSEVMSSSPKASVGLNTTDQQAVLPCLSPKVEKLEKPDCKGTNDSLLSHSGDLMGISKVNSNGCRVKSMSSVSPMDGCEGLKKEVDAIDQAPYSDIEKHREAAKKRGFLKKVSVLSLKRCFVGQNLVL